MAKRQLNARLPEITHRQIGKLQELYGMGQGEIIALAVDRMYRGAEYEPDGRTAGHERLSEIEQTESRL